MFARAHPDHLASAMIVDALPFVGEIFVPGATVAQLEPRAGLMRDMIIAGYGRPADAATAEGTAAGLALKPASRAKVKAWIIATDPRVSGQAMYEDLTTDLRSDIGAIGTPLTIVYAWSALFPRDRADAVYRAAYADSPKAVFVPIGDAAHFVMLDQPAAFAAALGDFADAR